MCANTCTTSYIILYNLISEELKESSKIAEVMAMMMCQLRLSISNSSGSGQVWVNSNGLGAAEAIIFCCGLPVVNLLRTRDLNYVRQ